MSNDSLSGKNEFDPMQSSSTALIERFGERLLVAKGDESTYALAKRTGITESLIRKYLSGASVPLINRAAELAAALKVDLTWLATGEGLMRPTNIDAQTPYAGKDARVPALNFREQASYSTKEVSNTPGEIQQDWEEFTLIPVYDVEASAGHGSHLDQELQTGQIAFRKAWLQEKGLEARHLVTIKAKGDSMMPTISDGDIVLVNTCIDKIIDDSLYIIRADHHLIVKRLQQNLDGSLHIISDNKLYKEQLVNPKQAKQLKIAGRVIWYGHEI